MWYLDNMLIDDEHDLDVPIKVTIEVPPIDLKTMIKNDNKF